MAVIDEAITALARHYACTEAEVTETLADFAEYRGCDLLESAAGSLIAALSTANDYGFDDSAVSAADEIREL